MVASRAYVELRGSGRTDLAHAVGFPVRALNFLGANEGGAVTRQYIRRRDVRPAVSAWHLKQPQLVGFNAA